MLDVNSDFEKLSRIDRRILKFLQEDGRLSYAELARRVGLSTTPCKERVKRLEREGYISAYQAILNPAKLQLGLIVLVQIRLNRTAQDVFEEFKHRALELNEVQECFLVAGNFDYLIKARVADMNAYRHFLGDRLLNIPGVQDSTSFVVMEEIKETVKLPITI